jgi:hypothetical protein
MRLTRFFVVLLSCTLIFSNPVSLLAQSSKIKHDRIKSYKVSDYLLSLDELTKQNAKDQYIYMSFLMNLTTLVGLIEYRESLNQALRMAENGSKGAVMELPRQFDLEATDKGALASENFWLKKFKEISSQITLVDRAEAALGIVVPLFQGARAALTSGAARTAVTRAATKMSDQVTKFFTTSVRPALSRAVGQLRSRSVTSSGRNATRPQLNSGLQAQVNSAPKEAAVRRAQQEHATALARIKLPDTARTGVSRDVLAAKEARRAADQKLRNTLSNINQKYEGQEALRLSQSAANAAAGKGVAGTAARGNSGNAIAAVLSGGGVVAPLIVGSKKDTGTEETGAGSGDPAVSGASSGSTLLASSDEPILDGPSFEQLNQVIDQAVGTSLNGDAPMPGSAAIAPPTYLREKGAVCVTGNRISQYEDAYGTLYCPFPKEAMEESNCMRGPKGKNKYQCPSFGMRNSPDGDAIRQALCINKYPTPDLSQRCTQALQGWMKKNMPTLIHSGDYENLIAGLKVELDKIEKGMAGTNMTLNQYCRGGSDGSAINSYNSSACEAIMGLVDTLRVQAERIDRLVLARNTSGSGASGVPTASEPSVQ